MNRRDKGMFLVEFAIIAAVLFLILLAVIELSRLIWVWNTVDEATRRGARVAAVCPINHPDITKATVFASYNPGSLGTYSSDDSIILRNLSKDDVDVDYLGADGSVLDSPTFETVRFVRVAINFTVTPLIPFFNAQITLPTFETTLPAESLGLVPDPDDPDSTYCTCFDVDSPCVE